MQKLFTIWSVILDSADKFWGGGTGNFGERTFPPNGVWTKPCTHSHFARGQNPVLTRIHSCKTGESSAFSAA